jgi:flagellar hook assembly protein FlgD
VYSAEKHDDNGNANIFWDGTEGNGKNLPSGVYMYIIELKGVDNVAIEQKKGTITLVRQSAK